MKISIITVCKNNRTGLLRAIECIRGQTYKNIEHIIVDGGSTDGTAEILRQAQNDTTKYSKLNTQYSILIISEADGGIYDAINKGIKQATGDVIGLLHSDDLYANENVIEKYMEAFERASSTLRNDKSNVILNDLPAGEAGMKDLNSERDSSPSVQNDSKPVDAVYSDLVYVKKKSQPKADQPPAEKISRDNLEDKIVTTGHSTPTTHYSLLTTNYSIIRNWKSGDPSSPQKMIRWLKNGWMPPHPTLFIRKEIFDKFGLYRTDLKIAADYEMILRLFYKLKIKTHYLPLTTYLMTVGGASNKNLKNILRKSKEDFRAMRLNSIPIPSFTLFCKNIRKLPQFLR
jgi:glycosyltransferase involved in cell wall biosynthesis